MEGPQRRLNVEEHHGAQDIKRNAVKGLSASLAIERRKIEGALKSHIVFSALSDRVKAGAAICWMTTTDYQLSSLYGKGKGDSNYANVLPGLRNYMDYPHIASLACPKPMLFFNGTSDKLFPVLAVEDAYSTMHHVWDSQSVGNQLKTMLWDTPHVCNRNMQSEVLSFFNAYLK